MQRYGVLFINGNCTGIRIEYADSFFKRFLGLMGREAMADDAGLMLSPCNQIHMFFMKFPIDALYINEEGFIIGITENMAAGSIGKTVKGCRSVIELSGGAVKKHSIKTGDRAEVFLYNGCNVRSAAV